MNTYSLENRLSKHILLTNFIIFILLALLINISVSIWLEYQYDESLKSKAKLLMTLVKDNPDGLDFDFADEFMPEFESKQDPEYFQIWIDNDHVFEKSRSLHHNDLPKMDLHMDHQNIQDLILMDGRHGRMIQLEFIPQIPEDKNRTPEKLASQKKVILTYAKQRESLDSLINSIHVITVIFCFFIIFTIKYLIHLAVHNALKPLNSLNNQIENFDVNNLYLRLKSDNTPTELAVMINHFNQLLERLEQSFYREQRFSSDIAHELRTPIAELRSMSEVALKWPNDTDMVNEFFTDVLESSIEMQTLVSNLLSLARSEMKFSSLTLESFMLKNLIDSCLLHLQDQLVSKSINICCEFDNNLIINTSTFEFEQIMKNLISNAISYSPDSSEILIQASYVNNHIELVVSNYTNNLEAGDLELMFDRLWRKEASRTPSSHTGLGLSLVKAYAKALDLQVSVGLSEAQLFSIKIKNIKNGLHK